MLRSHRHRPTVRPSARLDVEALEARCLLSANVLQTNLVSDLPNVAAVQDPNLVNPWGIAEGSGGPIWIADNNAGVSSIYNVPGKNNTEVSISSLVVNIPSPDDLTGNSGTPTGTVFNIALAKGAFTITDGTHTAPAVFLFATEDGTIVGWNPGVDPTGKFDGPNGVSTHAVIAVDNSGNNFTEPDPAKQTGAVYKGLAIGTDAHGRTLLYATNFRSGKVDVFNSDFTSAKLAKGAFTDPKLPDGYAPFGIQVFGDKVYVTYALQNATKHDDVAGQGHGFVDVYNLDGSPGLAGGKVRLITRGQLDSPWGLAIAPSSFGDLAGALLVGNFGNGRIHAYNATTGGFMGTLKDPDGEPIEIPGLWGLKVGNGKGGGESSKVYFTAGLFDETHGLFGSLTPVAKGTPEGPAEAQMVQADLDVVQLDLTVVLNDISSGAPASQLQMDLQTLNTDLMNFIQAEIQFTLDSIRDTHHGNRATALSGGGHSLHLQGLDKVFAELATLEKELHGDL
jgi:uncharacterized protein (TIGR03118 family)